MSEKDAWSQFAGEIGGESWYEGFSLWRKPRVVARVKQWTITFDTHTASSGYSSTTYTRIRVPYVNRDGFRFKIHKSTLFSGLGRRLGMQDIEVGYPDFDRDFVIQGNDESKVRALFANQTVRELIQTQPSILLEVHEGTLLEGFTEGVGELYFEEEGVIRDVSRLKSLYELFAETLDHLSRTGSAYEEDANVALLGKAIEIDPNQPHLYLQRGVVYANQGEFQRAIADFDKAIDLAPNDAQVYADRGLARAELGNVDQAIADLEKAMFLTSDPDQAAHIEGLIDEVRGQ